MLPKTTGPNGHQDSMNDKQVSISAEGTLFLSSLAKLTVPRPHVQQNIKSFRHLCEKTEQVMATVSFQIDS